MPLDEATCLLGLRLPVLCHYINTPLQTARRPTLYWEGGEKGLTPTLMASHPQQKAYNDPLTPRE